MNQLFVSAMSPYFSKRVLSIGDSATMSFRELVSQLEREGHSVIHMVGGEPDFITPRPIIEAAYRSMLNGDTTYSPPSGILPLRERIAQKLRDRQRCKLVDRRGGRKKESQMDGQTAGCTERCMLGGDKETKPDTQSKYLVLCWGI